MVGSWGADRVEATISKRAHALVGFRVEVLLLYKHAVSIVIAYSRVELPGTVHG